MNWDRAKVPIAVVVLALIPLVVFDPQLSFISRIFTQFLMFATLALALNVAFGHTDQLLLFTGGIVGVGTYTTMALASALGVSLWVTFLFGGLFAGVIGLVVCYVAARRRLNVIVISILTIALQLAMIQTFQSLRDITGGNTGMSAPVIDKGALTAALGLDSLTFLYYVFLVLLTALMAVYWYLTHSKYGLAFDTIRQDEVAAESTGVPVVRYKAIAGFITTFFMGLVGPFYIQIGNYVTPGMFTFGTIDVLVLIILVVGGMRTLYGPIVGAAIVVFLNDALQQVAEYRTMIWGLLLIFLFLFFRNGIVPFVRTRVVERYDLEERILGDRATR